MKRRQNLRSRKPILRRKLLKPKLKWHRSRTRSKD